RCVFKHHVYLCVVSTALMAGLSLITSHTSKAYAEQNCGSKGGGVVKTISGGEPIVCDRSSGTRTLNSSGGGEIKIDMDKGSGKAAGAAVTVTGQGTNITIIAKKLTVKGGSGDKPVIKVYDGGALTLNEEVNVTGVTEMQKAIVVEGQGSSVTLNGVLKGIERGEVKVSNEGMVVLGEKVTGIEEVKVKINDGGMVTLMEDVTFNNGSEAGIKITGSGAGKASVIGVGKTMTVTKGSGIEVEAGSGKVDATVMMLKIKGGSGGTGEMTMNMVEVSGFTVGVNAKSGTVNINGKSTIEVIAGGTGLWVGGTGNASMMGGKITGSGGGSGTGMNVQNGTGTLTSVDISKFGKGVEATGGKLKINMGSITFESGRGNWGMKASGEASATLTNMTIEGTGSGQGTGTGVVMESMGKTLTMMGVNILQVKMGVKVETGAVADLTKVTIKGGWGDGNGVICDGDGDNEWGGED
uniref:hypothetical protein n=1 Tax=Bartonella bovis TaxID=155194 RepID=UPI00195ACC28